MDKLRVLELFGGIGACTKALERLGIEYEVVDYVEIDKYAVKSFNAIHNTSFEPQDIVGWDKDIECDLIMHGSPCQDFSTAGKGAGGDKGSGTRSSLMYETLRIVEKLKPKYVIWENVKNLLSKRHRHNFEAYQVAMQRLGYNNYYQVLNARDYGIPQNRERVFTVSIRNDGEFDSFYTFPKPILLKKRLKDVIDDEVDKKYYLSEEQIKRIQNSKFNAERARENGPESVVGVLRARDYKGPQCVKIGGSQEPSDTMGTLQDYRFRKLTPKEYWRLMGFDDSDFEKAEKVNSNTQLYKQAGNSIVVDVLMAIFNELLGEKWINL